MAEITTPPGNSAEDSNSQTRNTQSNKGNQSFDETLRKKLDSQPVPREVSDDKKKKEGDLEPVNPEIMVPVASNAACLFIPQSVGVEDVEPLALSDSLVPPPEGLNKSQPSKTTAAPALGTVVVSSKTDISDNPLATLIPAEETQKPIPPTPIKNPQVSLGLDQSISQAVQTPASRIPIENTQTSVDADQGTRQAEERPVLQTFVGTPQATVDSTPDTRRAVQPPAPQAAPKTSADVDLSEAAKDLTAANKPEILSSPKPLSSGAPTETQAVKIPPALQSTETQLPIRNFTDLVEDSSQPKLQQNTLPKQENLSPEQLLAVQAESRKNSLSSKEGFSGVPESAQPLSGGIPGSTVVTEQTPRTPYAGEVHTTGADPARQVAETIRSSYQPGTQQITIRLDPPGVGKVMIRFIERSDGITGVLQVDNPQTRHEIQQALPGLIQTLQNADVQIKKLEVVQTSLQDNAASGEHLAGQHNGSGQHHSAAPHPLPGTSSYNQWQSNPELLNDLAGPQLQQITDHSINLLF